MNVSLCFFGQVKNYTNKMFKSFELNIIKNIEKVSKKIDYHIVTFNNNHILNPRNKENHPIDHTSIFNYFEFKSKKIIDIYSEEVNEVDELSGGIVERFGCQWKSHKGISTNFAIRQLYGLDVLFSLVEKGYDKYVLVRPDILFHMAMPMDFMGLEYDMYVPAWDGHGGYNDRMAALNHAGLEAYCGRFGVIKEKMYPYHSEFFLKAMCRFKKISVREVQNFKFKRVRANGGLR